jgi:SAM-dependent methyltransferase
MPKRYYRELAEAEYARAYGRGRRLLRYSDRPAAGVAEFAASRYFVKGGRAADFACGEGVDARYLGGLGCKVVGFDIASAAVQKARELTPGEAAAAWAVGDAVECPLLSETFDLVLAVSCFGRLLEDRHRTGFLKETFRVLKRGGYLLFGDGVLLEEVRLTFPDVLEELELKRGDDLKEWLREEASGVYDVPSQRYETRRGYENLLGDIGYRIVHSHLDVSAHRWGIVLWARKP